MAKELQTELDASRFIIENRSGANGVLAAKLMLTKPADGYALRISSSHLPPTKHSIREGMRRLLRAEFEPVAALNVTEMVLIAKNSPAGKDLAGARTTPRRSPGKLAHRRASACVVIISPA